MENFFKFNKMEEFDIICNNSLICVSDDSASENDSDDEHPALESVIDLDTVKVIVEAPAYDSMTVKELKEVVAAMGGPNLKTKKPMLDYIKTHNKILE
jgi:hypothetical protein